MYVCKYVCMYVCMYMCVSIRFLVTCFQYRMNFADGLVKSNSSKLGKLAWAWLKLVQDMVLRTWPKLGKVYYTAQEMTLRMAQGFFLAPAIYKSGSEHRTPSPSTG